MKSQVQPRPRVACGSRPTPRSQPTARLRRGSHRLNNAVPRHAQVARSDEGGAEDMRKLTFVAAILACLVTPVAAQTAKQVLTIDAPNDAATLDPHLQWDTDSYGVYRNIFDNRPDIKFQDGTPLSAEDVVFSVRRITKPALKSPQLSQFDRIADAEALGTKVRLTM